MSSGPPSAPPPPPPSRPTGFFDQFRSMPWWETLLVVAPLSLIVIGGLLGGIVGGSAAIGNMQIARRPLPPLTKVLVMLGVVIAAYVVFYVLYVFFVALLRASTA